MKHLAYVNVIPIDRVPGLPDEATSQPPTGKIEAARLANETKEFHAKGLRSRRLRDVTSEKYMLHVDGEGLSQYLDIVQGTRLEMVPRIDGIARAQNNQLRPILDNFVAHLTTQPFYLTVQSRPDRRSRQTAMVDQAIINADVRAQHWNALFREAKYIAACTGFCPLHSMWRDDPGGNIYEGAAPGQMPGRIDSWVGNPFDTVFNAGAKKGSLHRQTYGRVLPAEMVRSAFPGIKIEGSTRIVNASVFQRVIQRWRMAGNFMHGTAALSAGEGHEELIALVYDEIMPGIDPQYPDGCLKIIALQGAASTAAAQHTGASGEAVLLWKGRLPAQTFSSINIYSHHRFDDIHGKPYIGDIDDDQIELNQLESFFNEFIRRATRAPLASSAGTVEVSTISFRGDTVLEVEPMASGAQPLLQYLEQPARHMPVLENKIGRVLEGMYRKAGWQASSRGEGSSGQSGKAIIALQQADDSLFGPIIQGTKEEVEAFARLNWKIRKEFMDVETTLEVIGDELAHMAEPYVDRTMMSDKPPTFMLVSGFGTSTEAYAQQLLNLLGVTDAAGEPVLTTREFKKLWPDNRMYAETDDPSAVREVRPRKINELIRKVSAQMEQQFVQMFPEWQPGMADPFTAEMGEYVAMEVGSIEPALPDDDYPLHIELLSVITQDPSEAPLTRHAAMARQREYFEVLAMQQAQAQQAQAEGQGQRPTKRGGKTPSKEEAFDPAKEGGTTTADSMTQADREFSRRTA